MQRTLEELLGTKGRDGAPRGRSDCLLRLLALAILVLHWPSEARAGSLLVTRLSSQVSEYDAMTGSFIRTVAMSNTPTGVAVGPDGTVFIADQTRAEGDFAEILKVTSGAVSVFATEGIEGIFGITLGPNGNVFASSTLIGSAAKVVQYNGQTGALVGTFVAGPVNGPAPGGLAFGPNGDLFVGEIGEVREYDGQSGAFVRVFASGAPLNSPNGLLFVSGGNLVVADSLAGLLEFDGTSGGFVRTIDATGRFVGVAADPAGSLYASELDSMTIRSYDWPAGTLRGALISLPDFPEGIEFSTAGGGVTTTTTNTTTTTVRAAVAPGDILVVEGGGCAVPSVLKVDPLTGSQATISQGGLMFSPSGLFVDRRGDVLVSDRNGRLIRVNAQTGAQSLVATFGNVARGIVEESGASLLVLEYPDRLWRVDPDTGASALLSSAGLLSNVFGITVGHGADIFVTNLFPSPNLVRVNPVTGDQGLVYASPFESLYGVAVDGDGRLLVAEDHTPGNGAADDAIVRVDPGTGATTNVWQNGYAAIDVAVESADTLVILDQGPGSGCSGLRSMLLRFNRRTGATTTIVAGGLMIDTQAAVIVPVASGATTSTRSTTTTSTTSISLLPCTNPRCVLDAVLSGPCGHETVPQAVRGQLIKALYLLDESGIATDRKAARLKKKASKVLAAADHLSRKAALKRKPQLSVECASALGSAITGVRTGLGIEEQASR